MTDIHKKKTTKPTEPNLDLQELQQKINDLTEALQRERADASNVRRRADEERIKMAGYYKSSVIKELLPFIDNFDRALHHLPKDIPENKQLDEWLKGLSSIDKQLWQTLDSLGVKRIKTVGEHFDPKFHEAVQMDGDGDGAHEIITEEFMTGFSLDDDVLRHAMVKVASK